MWRVNKPLVLHVVAYTLYGVMVFLVALYVTFPYELVRQRLVERFSQGDVQLALGHMRPAFPLGVSVQNVRLFINHQGLAGAILQARSLRLRPGWLPLLAGKLQLHIDATLYGGRLQGEMYPPSADANPTWNMEGRFTDLDLERYPLIQHEGKASIRGRLGGDMRLALDKQGHVRQGMVTIHLQPMVFVGGKRSRFPLQRDITCDTLQGQLKLSPGQLQIASCTCKGHDLTMQARGTIFWRQPLQRSVLNLHLQIRSATAYRRELNLLGALIRRHPDRRGVLSFSIRGTIRQLRIGA